jgi:PucR family transcriptional regulator, purine catabolism regulatory protein
MRLTLQDVLAHPSVTAGQPRVVAGEGGLTRRVRWIHSSEVLGIASLLRGGELLLTGGEMLAAATAPEQRRYVRELAERRVTGVAIETGSGLAAIPPAVLSEADALGFPVIELRRRVPFVDVAEALNGELVNDSVTRLRYGGELAHAFSAVLTDGGGVEELLGVLAQRTGAEPALFDSGGRLIAGGADDGEPELGNLPDGGAMVRVTVRGAHAATLVLRPRSDTDPDLLTVASERAAEAIGLALLRSHPPSTRALAAGELARLAARLPVDGVRLTRLAQIVGLDPGDPVVAVAMATAGTSAPLAGLDTLLRPHGRTAMDSSEPGVRVVLSLPERRRAALHRVTLVEQLREWVRELDGVVVGVGPLVPGLLAVGTSMELAAEALRRRSAYGPGAVVDADATAVETLLDSPDLEVRRDRFIHAQLAMLRALRPAEGDQLMRTLEAYFDSGCNKTRTAEALHLQRQSLYGRLERAFTVLGGDPTGTDRALPLHLALKLRHGR